MIESHVTGPTTAAQRNFKLARQHSGANKGHRRRSTLLLDTRLSSNPVFANSTRHSVTSRIQRNSRLLCYLTFSTRHLNATLEKCNLVEKFNTYLRSWKFRSGAQVLEPLENPHAFARSARSRPPVPFFQFSSLLSISITPAAPSPKLSPEKIPCKASMMAPFARTPARLPGFAFR
jgi:hypothetical protein